MDVQVPSKRAKRLLNKLMRRTPAPTTVTMSGESDEETTLSDIEPGTTCSLYTPLTDKRSIRLLTIDASANGPVMSCGLVPACLDDPQTSYLALSYTWGDPKRTKTISCNGANLEATESLIGAIKQLACQYPGRSFWIDAICINQQDLAERAAQVQLMRDIYYQSAENVIIYLGEECAGLDRAMGLFYQLEKGAIEWEANNKANTTESIRAQFPPPYEDIWSDFHDLFSRPWFSRMWIIQEVVMASADPDVLCGRLKLHWSSFVRVANFFQDTGLAGSTIQKSKTSDVALIQDFKKTPRQLDDLLWMTRGCAATDPRDRIFALYGLVQLELMSDAMEHDGDSMQGLPSWVPDWSLPTASRHMSLGAAASYSGYNACGGQGTLVCGDLYDVDPDVLRIAGKIHDEVEWVSEALDSLDYSPLPWKRRPGVMERLWDDVRGRLGSDSETYHAFWRTLLANADKDGFPATDDLYPEFLRFWHDSKIHDRNARLYRAQHPSDEPLGPEQERKLFRDHAEDPEGYGKTLTEEDYAASKTHLDFQLSHTLPCTSTPDCRHCTALSSLLPELLKNGISVGGPSPALPFREKDPFIADFFRALRKDSRLMTCDFYLNILSRMRPVL